MVTIRRWSGREVRALREAKRMSLRAFAAHLGVSERMVSKWESGGEAIHPRPVNQAALDTSLSCSNIEVQQRFQLAIQDTFQGTERALKPSVVPVSLAEKHQVHHPVDGRLMAFVESGSFLAGENSQLTIWQPAFYIDVYPVTNADYARFVAATGHTTPQHWGRGRCPDGLFDHPVVYITWNDAMTYAKWAAKSLPTSKQWEKAARGDKGDVFPWGSQMTPAKCNVRENGVGSTTPVSRYLSGASQYGVYDMCGNTWEWCSTQTTEDRYELKGGAFTSPFIRAIPSTFNDASINMMDDDTSFRCATPAETMDSLLKAIQK